MSDQKDIAQVLKREYDYGKILITRALHNFTVVDAGLDLDQYILESNYQYFDEALARPWLFTRWVVMYTPDPPVGEWRRENEVVSRRWGESGQFKVYYELVHANDTERLYRLREERVAHLARVYGLSPTDIPSLRKDGAWEPNVAFNRMTRAQERATQETVSVFHADTQSVQ
jgi:hypothetical protein